MIKFQGSFNFQCTLNCTIILHYMICIYILNLYLYTESLKYFTAGLDMASTVIAEATKVLQQQFPSLHTFSTLSPIPNFMKWLTKSQQRVEKEKNNSNSKGFQSTIMGMPDNIYFNILKPLAEKKSAVAGIVAGIELTPDEVFKWLVVTLTNDSSNFIQDKELCSQLQIPVIWLACQYLANEKMKRSSNSSTSAFTSAPLDNVARFHLRNGASLHSVNWMANLSRDGLKTSAGV